MDIWNDFPPWVDGLNAKLKREVMRESSIRITSLAMWWVWRSALQIISSTFALIGSLETAPAFAAGESRNWPGSEDMLPEVPLRTHYQNGVCWETTHDHGEHPQVSHQARQGLELPQHTNTVRRCWGEVNRWSWCQQGPTCLLESYINDLDTANDDDGEEVEEDTAGGGSEKEEAVQKDNHHHYHLGKPNVEGAGAFFETKNMLDELHGPPIWVNRLSRWPWWISYRMQSNIYSRGSRRLRVMMVLILFMKVRDS